MQKTIKPIIVLFFLTSHKATQCFSLRVAIQISGPITSRVCSLECFVPMFSNSYSMQIFFLTTVALYSYKRVLPCLTSLSDTGCLQAFNKVNEITGIC